jgi:ATPase subunit of ABC transporter with duplicated ATPase domains
MGRFQDEVRFHRIQEQLLGLQKQQRQLKHVEEVLKNLALFGNSVRAISDVLKTELNNTLKSALPGINKKLTEAFKALTEHPAYNLVHIDDTILPKLELRIASEDAPLPGWQPTQVLNGQALNALELVPYFAFSELTGLPIDVYLLLLDDPTQSFDARHIEVFVAKLAELGKRVQLIVASHEVDHFDRLLPQYFGQDHYEVIRTTGFTRQDGPTLEIVHG